MSAPTSSCDYPTDADLTRLTHFSGTATALFETVERMWSEYGLHRIEPTTDERGQAVTRITLVTGGWSGNESVIGALRDTLAWTFFWARSERGGKHVFEIGPWQGAVNLDDWGIGGPSYDDALLTAARAVSAFWGKVEGAEPTAPAPAPNAGDVAVAGAVIDALIDMLPATVAETRAQPSTHLPPTRHEEPSTW